MNALPTSKPSLTQQSRLIVIEDPIRTEKEIIESLKKKLNCLLNEGAKSPIIEECVRWVLIQLENLGLTDKELQEIQ